MTSIPEIELWNGPRATVRNIYCIGRSYAEHAKELANPVPTEPVVFLKSTAALRPLGQGPLAFADETFHHEAELVVLLGRPVDQGAPAGWAQVQALALGLDLTRREVQNQLKAKGLPWTTAKSFSGSAIVTPFVPLERFPDPDAVTFTFKINDQLRQSGDTRELLFKVPTLLTHLASLNPLLAGDLVFTGTPAGVGPVRRGDRLELGWPELGVSFQGTL